MNLFWVGIFTTRFSRLAAVLFFVLGSFMAFAQTDSIARIRSPEIALNNDVTFQISAPRASKVLLTSGGDFPEIPSGSSLELVKGENGIWQLTLAKMNPGAYRYVFVVDGVRTIDPNNPLISESNENSWSLFHLAGEAFMDTQQVAHGAVAEVTYFSSSLNRHRRMHVYTPPGYEKGRDKYPVFYLLHGAMDSDDSWSTIGRAGFILDNLIAAGAAKPMIVVMPKGHTGPFVMGRSPLPVDEFVQDFLQDIKPYVEANYRIRNGRKNTAIAGLSMGGAHTLDITMRDLDEFAYIGVFSSGVFSITENDDWQKMYDPVLTDNSLKKGLKLFWFATGKDDFLLDRTKATVDLLRSKDFDITYNETSGGHTWINWRNYLREFAPLLF